MSSPAWAMASRVRATVPRPKPQGLAEPAPRVGEDAVPRRALAPLARMPRHLRGAPHALGMRHQDREAAVRGGKSRDAFGRAVRIVRIGFGRAAPVIDVPERDPRLRRFALRI